MNGYLGFRQFRLLLILLHYASFSHLLDLVRFPALGWEPVVFRALPFVKPKHNPGRHVDTIVKSGRQDAARRLESTLFRADVEIVPHRHINLRW